MWICSVVRRGITTIIYKGQIMLAFGEIDLVEQIKNAFIRILHCRRLCTMPLCGFTVQLSKKNTLAANDVLYMVEECD